MGQGKKDFNTGQHGNHMKNFDDAMEAALANTNASGQPQSVSFQVVVSANPGGVKEYIVNISP